MMKKGDQPSFEEFPLPQYEEWLKTLEKSLKGLSFDKLGTKTYEDIMLKPIYRSEDTKGIAHCQTTPGLPPYVRGNEPLGYVSHPWEVSQELSGGDPEIVASMAKQALERGQTSLHIPLDPPSKQGKNPNQAFLQEVGQQGLSLFCLDDVEKLLSQVKWEGTPLFIPAGVVSFPFICFLGALARKQGKDLVSLHGCIGADPFAEWVSHSSLPISLDSAFQVMAGTIRWTQTNMPSLQTICVQSEPYHNGGGNAVQELAFTLATAVEYIRELQEHELTIEEIAAQIRFSFSTGSSFFTEIAKLRAARLLWSKIIEAFGGSSRAQKMYIHARTSARTKTLFDPYVNILRSTTEALASIIGGANSLHVTAFDEATGQVGELSQRIARNTQLILDQEVHLSKVVDPAGGSWYIESLTDSIAEKAWGLFQEVERLGGMRKALIAQFPQQEVGNTAKQRKQNLDYRKDRWVGTNMYSNLQEPPLTPRKTNIATKRQLFAQTYTSKINLQKLKKQIKLKSDKWMDPIIDSVRKGLTLAECYQLVKNHVQELKIKPIQAKRTTGSFEALRSASLRYREQTGSLPKVYIANLGLSAGYKGRFDFVRDFFSAGGFQAIAKDRLATIQEAAASILDSGEDIAVLCTSPDIDPVWIQNLARRIKEQKQDICLLLAGKPAEELLESYKQAGIDDCIHLESNCFDMLLNLQRRKGIMP